MGECETHFLSNSLKEIIFYWTSCENQIFSFIYGFRLVQNIWETNCFCSDTPIESALQYVFIWPVNTTSRDKWTTGLNPSLSKKWDTDRTCSALFTTAAYLLKWIARLQAKRMWVNGCVRVQSLGAVVISCSASCYTLSKGFVVRAQSMFIKQLTRNNKYHKPNMI